MWSAIFYFNGTERLSPHGLAPGQFLGPDAPGLFRLFGFKGYRFGQDLGVELIGALAFGAAALSLALWGRRRTPPGERRSPSRLALAAGASAALWIATCFYIFSTMRSTLHLRYVEAMSAPVAAVLGVGIAACVAACVRRAGLLAPLLLTAATAGTVAFGLASDPNDHATRIFAIAAAALTGVAALAWVLARRRAGSLRGAPLVAGAALAVICAAATLAIPAQRSQSLVAHHVSDAGLGGSRHPPLNARARRYVAAHTRNDRYDVAVPNYLPAAQLIVGNGRPLVLSSINRRQVVSIPELGRLIDRGQVHYALIGGRCGTAALDNLRGCPRILNYIRGRSVDVSRQAGFRRRGELFRLLAKRPPGR